MLKEATTDSVASQPQQFKMDGLQLERWDLKSHLKLLRVKNTDLIHQHGLIYAIPWLPLHITKTL